MTTRRAVLGTAVWTLPTVMVSMSAPAIAASTTRDSLVFTNCTATVGKAPRTIYTNCKVMTREGEPVPDLTVTVTAGVDAYTTTHHLEPWGATDLIAHNFPNRTSDRIAIRFDATAPGHTPITRTVHVTAPTWWKEH